MNTESNESVPQANKELESSWDQLDPHTQNSALDITILSSERLGPSESTVHTLQIPLENIEKLVDSNWLNLKSRGEIAQEYVSTHQAEIDTIKQKYIKTQQDIDKMTDFDKETKHLKDPTVIFQISKERIQFLREKVLDPHRQINP